MQTAQQETGKQAGQVPKPGEHVVTGKEAQHEVKMPEKMQGEPVQVTIGGAEQRSVQTQTGGGRSVEISQESEQGQPRQGQQAGAEMGLKGSTPADIYPSRTLQQQQQGQQQPAEHGKEQELGAGEGITIQPMQREVSGLLKEGTGEPDTVDARGTIAVHQERTPIDHSKDDAARHPNAPVDYVETQESEGYKSREQAGKTRQPLDFRAHGHKTIEQIDAN